MHPELVFISNLWQIDAAMDRLRAEHEGLTAAARAAVDALKVAEAAVVAAQATRDARVADTRKNDRELADYVDKRDRTRTMINTGTAPDYAAAERQLAQVLVIVDTLETNALELMDALSSADRALADATKAKSQAAESATAARAALGARDTPIRTELAALVESRPPVAAALPVELRAAYAQQRQRKKPALVNTVENMCQNCHSKVPAQRVVETTLARALHNCPGCGGWLLP